ncbi:hypothetical protein C8J57DRAFT_1539803 [Mycena rebaudengoi]|nr:hypothetical protein C8J57DRAFT_1539803 [Mycena rebaudengoi]
MRTRYIVLTHPRQWARIISHCSGTPAMDDLERTAAAYDYCKQLSDGSCPVRSLAGGSQQLLPGLLLLLPPASPHSFALGQYGINMAGAFGAFLGLALGMHKDEAAPATGNVVGVVCGVLTLYRASGTGATARVFLERDLLLLCGGHPRYVLCFAFEVSSLFSMLCAPVFTSPSPYDPCRPSLPLSFAALSFPFTMLHHPNELKRIVYLILPYILHLTLVYATPPAPLNDQPPTETQGRSFEELDLLFEHGASLRARARSIYPISPFPSSTYPYNAPASAHPQLLDRVFN